MNSLFLFLILFQLPYSNACGVSSTISKFLSAHLNLADKDVLILFSSNNKTNQQESRKEFSATELLSQHPLGTIALSSADHVNETQVESWLHNNQTIHLAVCIVWTENTAGNSVSWPRKISTSFLKFRRHWVYQILYVPSISVPNVFREIGRYFKLGRKLHILTPCDEKEWDLSCTYELFSIGHSNYNSVTILESLSSVVIAPYSFRRGSKYNFQEAMIRATSVDQPYNREIATYNKDSPTLEFLRGLAVSELWDLREMLNFTIQPMKSEADISIRHTLKGPAKLSEGVGLQLLHGEADISVMHSFHYFDTLLFLKPLVTLGTDRIYALFLQPPSFQVRNSFTKPFQQETWIYLIKFTCLITITLLIFAWVQQRLNNDAANYFGVGESILWITATICQRSFPYTPYQTSWRIIFLGGLLSFYLVYSYYSGHIISSFSADFLPVRSLQDLIDYKFELISDPNQYYSYVVLPDNSFTEENRRNIVAHARKLAKTYSTDIQAVHEISKGFKMHFNTLDVLYLSVDELGYSDKEACETFDFVPLGNIHLSSGFHVPKGSPLQEPFNLKLLVMIERGLNFRYLRLYDEETLIKCPKRKTIYRSNLGFSDVLWAFIFLCVAMLVSLFILVQEVIIRKFIC